MLRSAYKDLGRVLGLSHEDAGQLFELLARQELAAEEAAAVCLADNACRYTGISGSLTLQQEREIAAQFGAETLEALKFYRASGNQRQSVAALRGELPDHARLSDAKANEL